MKKSASLRLTRIAAEELKRALKSMKVPGHPRPFYLSYLLRDEERWRIQAKYGALKALDHDRSRNAFVDVRVGSYATDHLRDGGLDDNDKEAESYGYVDLPFDTGADGLRHGLWRLTDARYREAVDALLQKKAHALSYLDTHSHIRSFEKRPATLDLHWTPFPRVDEEFWAGYVRRSSAILRRFPEIKDGSVEFHADHTCRVFVNSEGSRQLQCQPIWSLECYLWLLSDRGDAIPWVLKHMVTDPKELPTEQEFQAEIRKIVAQLRRLAGAEPIRAFCGPALLEPVAAGLLIHEAVGHRLEGNRLLSSGEGQTFKDLVGEKILPNFLSIHDDPTRARYDGRSLVGHYRFDDEGVAAQDISLVEAGKLKRFLTTRTCIDRRHHSSGHARSAYHQRPISRMGTLIIESSNGYDEREMKRRLLEEIERQGAPYGIRIVDATSGETATDAYNFQAFLGEANLATKVYPDGREEWVRGVNFVGTPLNAIRNIIASGNRPVVDNAYCGAESGDIPVSTISPSLLVSELELQAKPESRYTQFSMPIPWHKKK